MNPRLNANLDEMAFWWEGTRSERYWVEIRWAEGIGRHLSCPLTDEGGAPNPWYGLLDQVRTDDLVYHWNAVEHRFVGRSRVAAPVRIEGGGRVVDLARFTALRAVIDLTTVRSRETEIRGIRDRLAAQHPGVSLYLPFQFRRDGLRFMPNYFAKMPKALASLLFGSTGLGEDGFEPPGDGSAVADEAPPDAPTGFLDPFKPKADSDYITKVRPRQERRSRKHETLVNDFALYLADRGFEVGRNAVIDLGVKRPETIIEAKIVKSWPDAIRAAVGQLYEYRYFKVAAREAALVFLASAPVPEHWVRYLERDRLIGAAWPTAKGFELTPMTVRALKL